jgi:hypothetical protein
MADLGPNILPVLQVGLIQRTLTEEVMPNKLSLRWNTPLAIQRANEIFLFRFNGKKDPSPTGSADPGGVVVWDNMGRYVRIEVKDDSTHIHDKPVYHLDFLFMTIKMYVPPGMAENLHRISSSISYDTQLHLLTAGCHFIGASAATLSIVKEYVVGRLSLEQAMDAYDRRIVAVNIERVNAEQAFQATGDPRTYQTPLTKAFEDYYLPPPTSRALDFDAIIQ